MFGNWLKGIPKDVKARIRIAVQLYVGQYGFVAIILFLISRRI
jgi:hypothetical protein